MAQFETHRYCSLSVKKEGITYRLNQLLKGGIDERNVNIPHLRDTDYRYVGVGVLPPTADDERKLSLYFYKEVGITSRYIQTFGVGGSQRQVSLMVGDSIKVSNTTFVLPLIFKSNRYVYLELQQISVRWCQTPNSQLCERYVGIQDLNHYISNTTWVLTFTDHSERYCEIPEIKFTERTCQLLKLIPTFRYVYIQPLNHYLSNTDFRMPITWTDEKFIQVGGIEVSHTWRWVYAQPPNAEEKFIYLFYTKGRFSDWRNISLNSEKQFCEVSNSIVRYAKLTISWRWIGLEWKTNISERYIQTFYKTDVIFDYLGREYNAQPNITPTLTSQTKGLTFNPIITIRNIQSIDINNIKGYSFILTRTNPNANLEDVKKEFDFVLEFHNPIKNTSYIYGGLLFKDISYDFKTKTLRLGVAHTPNPKVLKPVSDNYTIISDGYSLISFNRKLTKKKVKVKSLNIKFQII